MATTDPKTPVLSKAPPVPARGENSWAPRQCACGHAAGAGGECAESKKKRLPRFSTASLIREKSSGVSRGIAIRQPQFGHSFDRIRVAPQTSRAAGLGEGNGDSRSAFETDPAQSSAATDPTGGHFSNGSQIVHTPACGGRTIRAIADPPVTGAPTNPPPSGKSTATDAPVAERPEE